MQLATQDLEALADFLLNEIDCSAEHEEDEFGIVWQGHRLFVQRKRSHFNVHHDRTRYQLPRI